MEKWLFSDHIKLTVKAVHGSLTQGYYNQHENDSVVFCHNDLKRENIMRIKSTSFDEKCMYIYRNFNCLEISVDSPKMLIHRKFLIQLWYLSIMIIPVMDIEPGICYISFQIGIMIFHMTTLLHIYMHILMPRHIQLIYLLRFYWTNSSIMNLIFGWKDYYSSW